MGGTAQGLNLHTSGALGGICDGRELYRRTSRTGFCDFITRRSRVRITIANRWKLEGGDDAGPGFWETIEDLRDTRPKRLRPLVPDGSGDEEPLGTFSVSLSTGRATVTFPEGATDADLLALVRAILNREKR